MTRFVNSVLISLIAFFAFLAVFGYFGAERPNAEPSELSVEGVGAQWAPGNGTALSVGFTVRNRGHLPGAVDRLEYEVARDGVVLGQASQELDLAVPASSAVPVQLAVQLPAGFATDWWTAYTTSGEASSLRVTGRLEVRGASDRPVAFEWSSSWTGRLAEDLAEPAHNCGGSAAQAVCLSETDASWTPSGLAVSLLLRNSEGEPVVVRNGTVRVLFAGEAVADGSSSSAVEIAPDDEGRMRLVADFSQARIAAWWPGHVARCESTPLALAVDLSVVVEGSDGPGKADGGVATEVQAIHWTFPGDPFRTAFVCEGTA